MIKDAGKLINLNINDHCKANHFLTIGHICDPHLQVTLMYWMVNVGISLTGGL